MAQAPFFATVSYINSSDTVTLVGSQPEQERQFSLAWVQTPLLRRDDPNEKAGFEAREFLRKNILGKKVLCTSIYNVPALGRDFGSIQYDGKDGPILPEEMVNAGWAKVREEAGRKETDPLLLDRINNLRNMQSDAVLSERGQWGELPRLKTIQDLMQVPNFLNDFRGKEVNAIVERILAGDRVLLRIILNEQQHLQGMTLIAGIRCPSTERTLSDGSVQFGEPFGEEAKKFIQTRLTQRSVTAYIAGFSPQGQLVAGLIHPIGGDISEYLLKSGYARCNDNHSTMLGGRMAALRAAEQVAVAGKLGLHRNSKAPTLVTPQNAASTDRTVTCVHTSDSVNLRVRGSEDDVRVGLTSIRGPRGTDPAEAPFRNAAKEYLRKRLIGKNVKVEVNGHKPTSDGYDARDIVTLYEKSKNINLEIVRAGWATVIRHRADDTDRAPYYDELLAAQEEAKAAKVGMHADKPPKNARYVDMSESVQKAKIQLSTLQRQRRVPSIIDFVKSGSRFTILIPRENAKITMVLQGIRAPRAPRADGQGGEPFGGEALAFAIKRFMQRDCEIDIVDIDKTGGFIGNLYIGRKNVAKLLVEEGLAEIHSYSAEKAGIANELYAAEMRAKEGRKGKFINWDPSQDEDEEDELSAGVANMSINAAAPAAAAAKRSIDYREIYITDIDESGHIKFQQKGPSLQQLETMMESFQLHHRSNIPAVKEVKVGDLVSAKFVDGRWYRARVRSNDRTAKQADVVYIDYGNSEKILWAKLRPLDEQFGREKLRPQASDASLAFIQLPTGTGYLTEAISALQEETDGQALVGLFEYIDAKESLNYITLYIEGAKVHDSVNKQLVEEGLAMITRKLKPFERNPAYDSYVKALKEAENLAKSERRGMWEYGDITED